MRQFDYREKWKKLLTPEIVSYLTQLVEIAKIQSTEASNKIEGIYTSDERLRALVKDTTRPRLPSFYNCIETCINSKVLMWGQIQSC